MKYIEYLTDEEFVDEYDVLIKRDLKMPQNKVGDVLKKIKRFERKIPRNLSTRLQFIGREKYTLNKLYLEFILSSLNGEYPTFTSHLTNLGLTRKAKFDDSISIVSSEVEKNGWYNYYPLFQYATFHNSLDYPKRIKSCFESCSPKGSWCSGTQRIGKERILTPAFTTEINGKINQTLKYYRSILSQGYNLSKIGNIWKDMEPFLPSEYSETGFSLRWVPRLIDLGLKKSGEDITALLPGIMTFDINWRSYFIGNVAIRYK